MNKELVKKIIRPFTGQSYQQFFYEKLYLLSLVGMNFAIGGDLKFSGEYATLKYVKSKLPSNKKLVLFDVGANEGDYTKAYLEVFKRNDTEIQSFEPSKTTYKVLSSNISDPKAHLNNFGLSNEPGTLKLYSSTADLSGNASVYQRNVESMNLKLDQSEEIVLDTLDNFCEKNHIDFIDMLKMDVEGHEFSVLQGSKRMLENRKINYIQFEFGGSNIDSRTYFKDFYDLLKKEYTIYRVLADGIRPIGQYNEMLHEIFTTINYLAELKSNKN